MKTISVEHLCRVEGNGGISATIDGKKVTEVKFNIYEGPRLIEQLTIGRTPEEDVSLAPRICAICTLSHKNAVLRAIEKALSVKVPKKTILMRELMHMGEIIESHSLHIFLLALPDYLGYPNAIAMAAKYDLEVKIGLEMKNFGNHIMKTISGRYIHGENPVIGGFGKFPDKKDLLWIKSRAQQFMPFVLKTVSLFCELDYPEIPEDETLYACCDPGNGKFGFWGEKILLSNGESIPADDYKKLTNEFVVSHSYAKHSLYKGKPYSVGALARINNLGERLDGEAGRKFKKYFNEHWKKNPLYHNAAQALEILYCFERIPVLVKKILKDENTPKIIPYSVKEGKGTGLVEAPRGLLIHHYEIKNGLVSNVDIITPTAQNAEDIERYCYIATQKLLDEGQEEKIRDRMDLVVRAFDPCISCSAHSAQVRQGKTDEWKSKLETILTHEEPAFLGIGNFRQGDDAVGIFIGKQLRDAGQKNVWLESSTNEMESFWKSNAGKPVIFLDAIDFQEKPGTVTFLPLLYALNNSSLVHKFSPFVTGPLKYNQLKKSYILGIQPASLKRGKTISPCVKKATREVLETLKSRQKKNRHFKDKE
ncbi:MAG: hydrogenase maturation protease [Candidatus Aminicenantes bacterium]|nr:hydrogenase maturation protease [Candidatus Aminicenantes bacterium]